MDVSYCYQCIQVADISVLGSWYSEFSRHDNPVVVIIDDMERSNGDVLAEFILMMRSYLKEN